MTEATKGDFVPMSAIQQICGYLWNERSVPRAEMREWVETWLDAYCRKAVPEFTPPAEVKAEGDWIKLYKPNGRLAATEGETYLFAIEVSTNGALASWEYFSDAIIWDSETEPQWSDGGHGWDLNDETWFRPLPAPPKPPEPR